MGTKLKRFELKTISTNHLLKQYVVEQSYETNQKKLRKSTSSVRLYFLSLFLSHWTSICLYLTLFSISYFFPSSSRSFYSLILYNNLAVFTHHSYLLNLSLYSIFNQLVCHLMGQSIQEWTKRNLWKTAFKKYEVICSDHITSIF